MNELGSSVRCRDTILNLEMSNGSNGMLCRERAEQAMDDSTSEESSDERDAEGDGHDNVPEGAEDCISSSQARCQPGFKQMTQR